MSHCYYKGATYALLHLSFFICQAQAVVANPLIVKEVPLFSNASFEENLKEWGGTAANDFASIRNEQFSIVDEAHEGNKGLAVQVPATPHDILLTREFTLPPNAVGQKYFLSGWVKTEGATRARLRVIPRSGSSSLPSPLVDAETDWTQVGISFEVAKPEATFQLRLEAYGELLAPGESGRVYFDDLSVQVVRDYAPHLRVRVLSGLDAPWKMDIEAMTGAPNWSATVRNAFKEPVVPDAWSPWVSLRGKLNGSREAVSAGLQFLDAKGKTPAAVKAQIQLAYAPQEEAVIGEITQATIGNIIGVFLPDEDLGPQRFLTVLRPLRAEIEARHAATTALFETPVTIEKYYIEGSLTGYGKFYSDPALVQMEVDTLRAIGFNALSTQYSGLANEFRAAAARRGITRTHHTIGIADSSFYRLGNPAPFEWEKGTAILRERSEQWLAALKQKDAAQVPLIEFLELGDEASGVVWKGEEYDVAYRDYLKEHNVTPAELGAPSWEQVKTFGSWDWRQARKNRPDKKDEIAARNYYWTLRFWNYANARWFAEHTKILQELLPQAATRVNFGMPWAAEYGSYLRGIEYWEFARQRSITSWWNEDWLNTNSFRNSGIQMVAYLTDLNRSLAAVNDDEWNMYIMPENEKHVQLKMASAIGKGAKKLSLYKYGPAYASSDNWSDRLEQAKGVGEFLRKLAPAEGVLYAAKPRPASVAIIWPQSDALWRDGTTTLFDGNLIYLALLHQQVPVDFVDEFAVAKGALANYDVAYLHSEYLRRDAQKALVQWVQNGGHLWADGKAGMGDEYGQPSALLLPVYGIENVQVENRDGNYNPSTAWQWKPLRNFRYGEEKDASAAVAVSTRFQIKTPTQTRVLAAYEDGSPAVIRSTFGKGSVQYVSTLAGLSYAQPVSRVRQNIETGYRATERRIITDFALQNGIERPVVSSVPVVEADLLEGPNGIGIMLANYSGAEQEQLTLTIASDKKPAAVQSVSHGVLPFQYDVAKQQVKVSLPLNVVDFLLVK